MITHHRLFQFSYYTRYQQTLNNFEHFLFDKSHQRDSIKKMFLKISRNSQQTRVSQSLFSNKVTGLSRATLLKKRLRDRYFPVSFPKKLRTHFLQNTFVGRLWISKVNRFQRFTGIQTHKIKSNSLSSLDIFQSVFSRIRTEYGDLRSKNFHAVGLLLVHIFPYLCCMSISRTH